MVQFELLYRARENSLMCAEATVFTDLFPKATSKKPSGRVSSAVA